MSGFRTIVINSRCKLESRFGYLVIRSNEEIKVHISEIETLIIESTACAITSALIVDLVESHVNVIFCDRKHLPLASILPKNLHYNTSKNIHLQLEWSASRKALCWQHIIQHKIKMQAELLRHLNKIESSLALESLCKNVLLGDEDNKEATAARCYFVAMFGDYFVRADDDLFTNQCLNYGYAVLFSIFAREIVASGYITEIGLWHRSAANAFNLASDLMEPFRPIIDAHANDIPVSEEDNFKHYMVRVLEKTVKLDNESQNLTYAIRTYIRRIFKFMNNETEKLCDLSFDWKS
jgi:CRISPR-associated endonuclease Cas1 subtype II